MTHMNGKGLNLKNESKQIWCQVKQIILFKQMQMQTIDIIFTSAQYFPY